MVLYATIARKGQGPLPFACLESGRVERGEGRKKRGVGKWKEGGGVVMVLVVVVVVDMYMGWVRKKLLMTLPALLHGVST